MGFAMKDIEATELGYWASLGRLKEVIAALAANADANVRGVNGYTAMHAAAINGHLDVIRFLAAHGANLDAQLDFGETPLMLAKLAKEHEAVALLESLGARECPRS